MDITHNLMARSFTDHASVIDWFRRSVVAWKLSITLDTGFCIKAIEEGAGRIRQAQDLQHG